MFTGLIETVGELVRIEKRGASGILTVKAELPEAEIALGASIAVNGACLTVVRKGSGSYSFDVSPETIDRTAFRNLKPGAPLNLERAMRLSDRLDGHLDFRQARRIDRDRVALFLRNRNRLRT
jgi:riboflavin synthase